MLTQFSRTELLLGKEAMNKLEGARVAVFCIGGVGGYVCEALVRSGVGKLDLIDNDKVCMSSESPDYCDEKHSWQIQNRSDEESYP